MTPKNPDPQDTPRIQRLNRILEDLYDQRLRLHEARDSASDADPTIARLQAEANKLWREGRDMSPEEWGRAHRRLLDVERQRDHLISELPETSRLGEHEQDERDVVKLRKRFRDRAAERALADKPHRVIRPEFEDTPENRRRVANEKLLQRAAELFGGREIKAGIEGAKAVGRGAKAVGRGAVAAKDTGADLIQRFLDLFEGSTEGSARGPRAQAAERFAGR